ncbi:hypothetical protein XENOCAPTIV_018156 [Xenoophorus captivus]|uniref:Uncharacterized protein n=1 Tax=Xenoophorus captivus TaxID=1517983 RepID=A0ABV0R120_9TELE
MRDQFPEIRSAPQLVGLHSRTSATVSPLLTAAAPLPQPRDVRPDAGLPARREDGQDEKVEENFVGEFQKYRFLLHFVFRLHSLV